MQKPSVVNRKVTQAQFLALVKPILGLPVSRAWRGYGSACFLEIGELFEYSLHDGRKSSEGQFGVMIEWSWRIEKPRSILCGSWSSERKINNGIANLQDRVVEEIVLSNRLPEISIKLSGGRWLQSFMTAGGEPRWSIFFRNKKGKSVVWLTFSNGRIVLETDTQRAHLLDRAFEHLAREAS
jgi:hypothetical protein